MVKCLQVTIGASATQVTAASCRCKWARISNRATHTAAAGDSTVTVAAAGPGILLAASTGTFDVPWSGPGEINLAGWYVAGTQNDVISVTYDDGADVLA